MIRRTMILSAVLVALVPCAAAVDAWASTLPVSPVSVGPAPAGPQIEPLLLVATVRDGGAATRGTMSSPDDSVPSSLPPVSMTGDCSQVAAAFEVIAPELAATGVRLAKRESQCCPQVRGGDVVNDRCEVVRVADWSHRSDSGLFQLNWVWHYDAGVLCTDRGLCGPESITELSVIDQVAVFAWIVDRYGLCHWSPPDYCA